MAILAGIAVPLYFHFMDGYRRDLCEVNRVEMARLYAEYLMVEQIDHSAAAFAEFSHLMLDGEVCPVDGELTFVDGNVECSVHGDETEK